MPSDNTQPFEHDENVQAFEREGNILIAIVDETYGKSDEGDWEKDREQFRLSLECEFGRRFEDGNIGPGADFPVFITLLQTTVSVPLWQVVAAAFFLGKPLKDNFDAWREIGTRVRSYFKRPTFLNRQGAAVIAVEAVFDAMGGIPKTLRLLSYRTSHISEPEDLSLMERATEIADPPATLYLGFVKHVFEIEADGALFRVSVDGRQAKLIRLP